jgi:hypothetical protein
LAVGPHKGDSTLIFAGVNSELKDLQQGKNDHFRVFGIKSPKAVKAKAKGKGKGKKAAPENDAETKTPSSAISEISRSQLFAEINQDTYQRVIRLSKPVFPDQPQLGAVSTGDGKVSEIVVFDTNTPTTPMWSLKTQKKITKGKTVDVETVDLDILQTGDNEYLLGYCNAHDIYIKSLSSKPDKKEPTCVYVTPFSDSFEKPTVPKFSALRWLTKDLILMLTNIHSTGGAVLQILRLPLPGDGQGHCRIIQSHRLPSSVRSAGRLAVANLTPPATPNAQQGYTQFAIAVGAGDLSIHVFKSDFQVATKITLVTPITPLRTFKADREGIAITNITFSNFTPPTTPITAGTPAQHLKLASTGSNTVVMHTLPLFPVPLSVARGQSETPRYVLALPPKFVSGVFVFIVSVLGAIFVATIAQSILEIRGMSKPLLNATNYVPLLVQEAIGKPYTFPQNYWSNLGIPTTLPELYTKMKKEGTGYIVIQDTPHGTAKVKVQESVESGGKTWEELSAEHKEGWKKKLMDAGHWTENMGETILKGVIFGELGGAIGQAVGQAVGG